MTTFLSRSVEATAHYGHCLGTVAEVGDVVALVGDLGAGKTHFVQAMAIGLGVPSEIRVTSPTFTLVNIYQGGRLPLIHADLYRLERERELIELGLDEWIEREGVVAVEWADRFPALPTGCLNICLEVRGDNERSIEVNAENQPALNWLKRWKQAIARQDRFGKV